MPLLLYCAGWVLMTAAMMLPTVLPLVRIFDRIVSGRSNQPRCMACSSRAICWRGVGLA